MKIVDFEGRTRVLNAPDGWNKMTSIECDVLPIIDTNEDGMPIMSSFWKPSADDLRKLKAGEFIRLSIFGRDHPPVAVEVAPCVEIEQLQTRGIIECQREGCTANAVGALGFAFYPHKAVMEHYGSTNALSRMLIGIRSCAFHFEAIDGPFELFPPEQLKPIAELLERSSGTAVDLEATKVVLIPFDDPEYIAWMRSKQDEKKPGTEAGQTGDLSS